MRWPRLRRRRTRGVTLTRLTPAPLAGDELRAFIWCRHDQAVTPPAGWTLVARHPAPDYDAVEFAKIATSADSQSTTFTIEETP